MNLAVRPAPPPLNSRRLVVHQPHMSRRFTGTGPTPKPMVRCSTPRMVDAATVLADCRARDIRLWGEEGNLRYDAPAGTLDPNLQAALVAHKAEILTLLAGTRQEPPPVPLSTTGWSVRWRSLTTGGEGWEDRGPLTRAEADDQVERLNRFYADMVHHWMVPASVEGGGS
jgi:hypothetical protein